MYKIPQGGPLCCYTIITISEHTQHTTKVNPQVWDPANIQYDHLHTSIIINTVMIMVLLLSFFYCLLPIAMLVIIGCATLGGASCCGSFSNLF